MNNEQFLASLSFEFLEPATARGGERRFSLTRGGRPPARLLELPHAPVDALNTRLPAESEGARAALRELCEIPRMSTFAIAALIDHAVGGMPKGHAFLNVGVWAGFTFLAGVRRNPDRRCLGVDDFSGFGGPRESFTARFEKLRSDQHSFFEMDYLRYFEEIHREPLGVYMYDGDHAYEHQLEGLRVAEPFFASGCLVLVDDTNRDEPHRATLDFVAGSDREYRVLLDCRTADSAHPTFWDGLIVLEATGEPGQSTTPSPDPSPKQAAAGASIPIAQDAVAVPPGSEPLVSIVLVDDGDAAGTDAALEAAHAQTWPNCEVLVTERGGIRGGIDATTGDYVAFADAARPLRKTAVHMGLALPNQVQFFRSLGDARYREREESLPALGRR